MVVKGIEVKVGEELAGEVADRDADAIDRWRRGRGDFSWGLGAGCAARTGWGRGARGFENGAVVDDAIDQPKGIGAFDFAADERF